MSIRGLGLAMMTAAMLLPAVAHAQGAHERKASTAALAAVRETGRVRVLVMLRDPGAPSSAAMRSQPKRAAMVRASVDAVLASLPRDGHRIYRRFQLVPAVAMVVDQATLHRLENDPAVSRVDVDAGGSGSAQAPDEASVLNHVSGLQAGGLGGAGMKVAVIDTGVDTDHVDLRARLVGQQCFCSSNGGAGGCCPNGLATQSGNGAAEDDNGHGTNVAGIIVGEGNVAPRGAVPEAQLVAVKVIDSDNRFCCTSDVVAAMDWLATNHPDVDAVNMSLGTDDRFAGDCDAATAFTQALAVAVDNLVARGAVVTVSNGNQGDSARSAAPACVAKAVGVGATWDFSGGSTTYLGCTETSTAPMQTACFSNRSATTDLYAAGAFVTSAGNTGGTSIYGGTSMAAPMVAACAVALKQAAPIASVEQRIEVMKLSPSRVTDPVSGRSYPFLDCMDAARLLDPSLFRIRVNGSQPRVHGTAGASPNVPAQTPPETPATFGNSEAGETPPSQDQAPGDPACGRDRSIGAFLAGDIPRLPRQRVP